MTQIKENDKAVMRQIETGEYEVFIKIPITVGPNKGQILEPTGEDFGVWAWSAYTKNRANDIFQEITDGRRVISPMVEYFEG
jgi:hypothetical protein